MAFDLTYLGHSAFEIKTHKQSILIDPFLQASRKYDYRDSDITDIFITHGHSDHIGSAIDIAINKRATITAIFELANYCTQKGTKTRGVNFGAWLDYEWGRALFVPAFHSSSSPDGVYLGEPAGVILEVNGVRIYHAGDTALFSDMKFIRRLYSPDIVMLPVGGVYTMDIEHAAIAAKWLKATITIPMHYNTFDAINVDISRFDMLLQTINLNCQIMEPDEVLNF
ncbi:metal-dependent hydrolase [bacterium]|nr:metal-dependent hydrolase [bacterium]